MKPVMQWIRPDGCARVHFVCDAESIAVLEKVGRQFQIGDTAFAPNPFEEGQHALWRCINVINGGRSFCWQIYAEYNEAASKAAIAEATVCVFVCDRNGGFSAEMYDPRRSN